MREDLKAFSKNTNTPMYVQLAGVTFPDPTYRIFRPDSFVTVIEYIIDGVGYVSDGEKNVRVSRDMVYMILQGEDHTYFADKQNPYTKIFINVSGKFCNDLISSYNLSGKHFFDGKGLRPIFEKIPKIIHSELSEGEMQSALQGVFLEIIARLSLAQTDAMHSEEALKIKSYLDLNLSRLVNAKELAGVVFRSPDYCLKLFLREFGITPYSYQISRKMQVAKSLLRDTNMSIEEIAESLGYSDAHYFSNLFLQKCGSRPTSYRKSIK